MEASTFLLVIVLLIGWMAATLHKIFLEVRAIRVMMNHDRGISETGADR